MAEGAEFSIDLGVQGGGAVDSAAASLAAFSTKLELAGAAATATSEAVKAGQTAYDQAEAAANRAALAVEKIGLKADAQRGKLQAAMDAGDGAGAERAAAKLATLVARQGEAATKAAAATTAMNAQAVALDGLKSAAANAAAGQAQVAKAFDAAKAKAAEATKAIQAAGKPINAGEAAGALGKLGGPLGSMGQKAFDAADAFKKMGSSLGSAGPYVAVAVGIAAIVAGVVAVSAAAVVGIASITAWAIKLADANGELPKLQKRASDGFKKIFSGLNIKPLLGELGKVADLFDEGSASAKAIKVVFESLFQPIVDGIAGFVPKMVRAFIQFEILVLKALIAIKPFGSTILMVAEVLGVVALVVTGVLALAIGVLVAGVAAMAVGFTVAIAVVAALVAGFVYLGAKSIELGVSIIEGIGQGIDWLKSLSLSEIGTMLIDGLVAGITAGGAGVLKAITGIAGGAIDAAKAALGIASPSKIFAEIGMNTAAGMEEGVDGGASGVAGSLEAMVAPPVAAPGDAASPAAASGGGGGIVIQNLNVTAPTGADVRVWAEQLRAAFADLATQATGGSPVAP